MLQLNILSTAITFVPYMTACTHTHTVEGTMAGISSTLTTEQCIEVSINQHCNESPDSFQARLLFADGACQNTSITINTTENTIFQNDYKTCIPVGIDPICFSAVVYRNGVEVARTMSRELILLQCNTSTLNLNDTGVELTNSSSMPMMDISSGVNVPHNNMLYLQCSTCALMGTNTTRCVNGTFDPLVNQSTYCNCPVDPPLCKLLYRVSGYNTYTVILSTDCFVIWI